MLSINMAVFTNFYVADAVGATLWLTFILKIRAVSANTATHFGTKFSIFSNVVRA